MTNFRRIIFLFFVLLCSACSFNRHKKSENSERPNIVLIISDDQSWTDYSFMGHEYIQTPRLDQLAAQGLTFTHGYTTAPLCSPALASIATGLYPHQHGILGNDPVFSSDERKYSSEWLQERMEHYRPYVAKFEEMETIADVLGEYDYTSLQTGKWWPGSYTSGGFDEGMTHGDPARGGRHGDEGLKIGREGLDVVYRFIDSAKKHNTPFYLWYAPFLPHAPHNPPDSLKQKYLRVAPSEAVANYWAMCEWFDITCGQLMDYVEQKGLSQNTLFVYVCDNGWIQDPDKMNVYAPRSKREPYEMGIRTPIIFRWKGMIDPETNETDVVSSIDIATTIYGICGIDPPASLQGINVLDSAAINNRKMIFAETFAHDFSTIDSSLYYRMVIQPPFKLIVPDKINKSDAQVELFNIRNDPFEMNNLAESVPEKVEELKKEIEGWWSE